MAITKRVLIFFEKIEKTRGVCCEMDHIFYGEAFCNRPQRATFIVDPEGITRFVMVTDLNVGRNPKEVLRVLDALQTKKLCACNWQKGEEPL
jgi:alkyl hydroperoxide reductase subunit AhpC